MREHGVRREDYRRDEIHPWMGSVRGHRSPSGYPRVRRRVLHWTLNLHRLPRSESDALAAMYGWVKTVRHLGASVSLEGVSPSLVGAGSRARLHDASRVGVRVHPSRHHVASRRVRQGDLMGVSVHRSSPSRACTRLSQLLDERSRYVPEALYPVRIESRPVIPGYPYAKDDFGGDRAPVRPLDLRGFWSQRSEDGQFLRPLPEATKLPSLRPYFDAYHRRGKVSQRSLGVVWSLPPKDSWRSSMGQGRAPSLWRPRRGRSVSERHAVERERLVSMMCTVMHASGFRWMAHEAS